MAFVTVASVSSSRTTLHVDDLLSNGAFAEVRDRLKPLVADIRRLRRHALGSRCTIAFENRETVLWQIQEVLRVEGRSSPHAIEQELDRYRPLLPQRGELRATVFVDAGSRRECDRLCDTLGTDRLALRLQVADRCCFGECVDEQPELPSPVRYFRFDVGATGITPFEIANRNVKLVLRGGMEEPLPSCLRQALASDLWVSEKSHVLAEPVAAE